MTSRTFRTLAALAAGLVLLLVVVRSFNGGRVDDDSSLLLPKFAAQANEVDEIRISGAENPDGTTIRRGDSGWVVSGYHDYPADLAKLRQLVIALSEASIIEEKTSNPEYYERLGLGDPDDGGNGTKVTASAGDTTSTVIFGETAQGEHRYARNPETAASYLVDRNPELPQSATAWLEPNVADVLAGDISRIVITHADGERVELAKGEEDTADYAARTCPKGANSPIPRSATASPEHSVASRSKTFVRRATPSRRRRRYSRRRTGSRYPISGPWPAGYRRTQQCRKSSNRHR